jgi:hypothetical protein
VSFEALRKAARRAALGKRDREEVARFLCDLEPEVLQLERELKEGSWRPGAYRTFTINDPKERTISAAPFRDRVVHHAVCAALGPVIERRLIDDTFACRKGKGTLGALRRAQLFARRHGYSLNLDISRFFDSVDHSILKKILRSVVKDQSFLSLLDTIVESGGIEGRGLPIGNLTSQWFANLYLDGLDHFVKETLRVPGYVRYMDDLLLFAGSKARLRKAYRAVQEWLASERGLQLKERVARLAPTYEGLPFLGWQVYPGQLRRRRESLRRSVRRLRWREAQWQSGQLSTEKLVQAHSSVYAHLSCGGTLGLRRRLAARARADP